MPIRLFRSSLRRSSRWVAGVAAAASVAAALVVLPLVVAPVEASPTATSPTGASLALTPPMGFNNWAAFGCSANVPFTGDVGPSESLILAQAHALVSDGLAAKGYNTVTIDDCWMTGSRDSLGNLVANPALFPDGMAYIGAQLHGMGLKFGIYEDIGTNTCGGYAGSWGHFQQDANLFASWGVDYVKMDGCNMPQSSAAGYESAYAQMGLALKNNSSGRNIVFSESSPAYFYIGASNLSDWYSVINSASQSGQLWREGNDVIMANQTGSGWTKKTNESGVLTEYDYNWPLSRYAAPGSWNDPDSLITGDNGLTNAESQSQFALYAMMASPLFLGVDLTTLSPASLALLSNTSIIAIDQDPLGQQATMVSQNGTVDVLAKPLSGGDRAVALFNRGGSTVTASTTLSAVGFLGSSCSATVTDQWGVLAPTTSTGTISASVPSHGTAIFRVHPGAGCAGAQSSGEIVSTPAGAYSSSAVGSCLTVSTAMTTVNVPVVLSHCAAAQSQLWTRPGDGTVRSLGMCLDAAANPSSSGYQGYLAVVSTCDGSAAQQWTYNRNGFLSNSSLTNQCIDDEASNTADGTPIIVDACGNAAPNQQNQVWDAPGLPGGGSAASPSSVYLATSPGNTLAGGAKVLSCTGCTTGSVIGNIGNGGTLTFNNVVPTAPGREAMTFGYVNGDDTPRTALVSVNGGPTNLVAFAGNGNWNTEQSLVVDLTLAGGSNTIAISMPGTWAPGIDEITVPAQPVTVPSITYQAANPSNTVTGGVTMTSLTDSDGDSIAVAGPLVTFMSDSLTFAGVAAAHAGTAWLTLSAVANGSTQLNMIVNGDAATEVDIAPGYIPNALQSQVVPVLLQAGDNTITFTDFSESAVPVYLGSISVTQPATVYEAEAPGNTLAGGAVRVLSSASPPANWSQEAWDSSGRAYVGDLGGSYDGTLQINGIQSATAGEHLLSISVIVSGTRVMWIGADTENGQQLQEVTVTGTSWNTPEVIQVPVFLQAMSGNFIYFQGDGLGDPMPDIDALSIS